MLRQPAAKDLENLARQFRAQLPSQFAKAAEADDGHEQLLLQRLGIGPRDPVQQRCTGGIGGGQGRRQAIGHGVEGGGALMA